jgi:hypothetical protein
MKIDSDAIVDMDNRKQGQRDEAIEDAKAGHADKCMWTHHAAVMVQYEKGIKRCRQML